MRSRYFLAGVFLSLATAFTLAQEITGDIRGIVRDPSGAVVNGAAVQVLDTERNSVVRALKTGADGAYIAPLLPVGRYQITVAAPGFQEYNATDVVLNVNDRRVLDINLTELEKFVLATNREAQSSVRDIFAGMLRFTRTRASANASTCSSARKRSTC
jgi:hypothetical protein